MPKGEVARALTDQFNLTLIWPVTEKLQLLPPNQRMNIPLANGCTQAECDSLSRTNFSSEKSEYGSYQLHFYFTAKHRLDYDRKCKRLTAVRRNNSGAFLRRRASSTSGWPKIRLALWRERKALTHPTQKLAYLSCVIKIALTKKQALITLINRVQPN